MLFCVQVSKVNLFPDVPYLTEEIERKGNCKSFDNPYTHKLTGAKLESGRVACIFHIPSFFPFRFGY